MGPMVHYRAMRTFAACAILLATSLSHADEEFLHRWAETSDFQLGRPKFAIPTRDGKVLFLRSGPRSRQLALYEYDVATRATREVITADRLLGGAAEKLTPAERARRERMRVAGVG